MSQPKVSIIIPTRSVYTKLYLDLCIRSIRNLDYPQELLDIVISSPIGYVPLYSDIRTVHHPDPAREFAEAVNYGVEQSDKQSSFILLLSDDVVMTKNSLKNMVKWVGDDCTIMNATSNCDNYWKYMLQFSVGDRPVLSRFLKLEDIDGHQLEMMNAESAYPPGMLITDTLCFYATLIPRATWEHLGQLDERFKTGYEDTDYSNRARAAGIPLLICLDAIIWHFGGITSSESVTDSMREANLKLYEEKYK